MAEQAGEKRRRIGWEMYMGCDEEEEKNEQNVTLSQHFDDLETDKYNPFGEPVRINKPR